jgi:hypothetical protein
MVTESNCPVALGMPNSAPGRPVDRYRASEGRARPHPSCRRPRPGPTGSPDARGRTGQRDQVPAAAVLVMTGAETRTQWRRDLVKLNDRGFILTGRDVPPGAHDRCPVRPCRSRRACQAVTTLAAQIRETARREPARAKRSPATGAARCAGDQGVPHVADAGVQVKSRFRNLRGSAAGLSLV